MRTPGGYYVSEAYLNTGTNSSVGLPLCVELDFEAAQAATGTTVPALTVADYHREGWGNVGILNSDQTSGRFYFSKAASRKGADALNKANGDLTLAGNLICATAGVALGLVAPEGTVVASIEGFSADMMCGAFAGSLTPENFEQALGAAHAAASAGKCFEIRAHRKSADQDWIYDVYTVTGSADYCG